MRKMRSYSHSICAAMLALACWPVQAAGPVLDAWHYGTLRLSSQRCEASFIFDAGPHSFRAVRVQAIAKDRQGQVLARFTLEPDDMGVDRNNRFATARWISPHACGPEVVVVFKTASAQIEGMPTDLLAHQQLRLRRYEPMELRLPQTRERP
ncbi:MAG: hypothetical protein LBE51_16060 [Acidovorax sp.]|jgi:hypothetical protein|nr:hypothetical protein [Acidovorax sp.]